MDSQDLLNQPKELEQRTEDAESEVLPPNSVLASFVQNPTEFRNALDESGAILVIPPVSLLEGKPIYTKQLRLIGPPRALGSFLKVLQREGYQINTQPGAYVFDRLLESRKSSIVLECVDDISPQAYLIQTSITTEDLCFMTAKYAVCICPKLTLGKKYLFLSPENMDQASFQPLSDYIQQYISLRSSIIKGSFPLEPYLRVFAHPFSGLLCETSGVLSRRGYELAERQDHESEINGQRFIGDEHCFVMKIDDGGNMTKVPPKERESKMGIDSSSSFSLEKRIIG
ncbi:hypothetical protein PG999_010060 [Apiospora kogelbergensis]|uniref:Uncharacterized protein n=1 Tax=Apiospora kogelbergensis TaxID=1337665 RepID=A0AAW0QUB3_9PEZI